jgi:arylsulfatase A-like enzyme
MPQGVSLLPVLEGKSATVRPVDAFHGVELFGARAMRQGDSKITWDQAAPPAQRRWRLFDLATDLAEQHDLSVAQPAEFERMKKLWDRYEAENGVVY